VHARASIDVSLREAFAGFRFLFRENERVLVGLTATAAGLGVLAGAYYVLAVELCTQTFHFGGQGVGWLDAMYGVGGLAGGVLVGLILRGRRIVRLFTGGAVLNCLGVILLATSPSGPLPFAFIALVGIAGAVVQVTATTIVQAAAPRDMLGRAFTAFEAALVGAMLIGALVAGPLVRAAGPRGATLTFALAGGILLLLSLTQLQRLEEVLGVRIFLRGVPILADLARPLLDDLAARFQMVIYPAGELIVQEGEAGDRLYIVHTGTVEISVGGRIVRRLGPAGYFGEVALLRPVARTASVRACTSVSAYALDRPDFEDLLGHDQRLEPRLVSEARASYHYGPAAGLFPH
jgi:MFS family permease